MAGVVYRLQFIGPIQMPRGYEILQLKSDFDIVAMPLALVKDAVYAALLQQQTEAALEAVFKAAVQ